MRFVNFRDSYILFKKLILPNLFQHSLLLLQYKYIYPWNRMKHHPMKYNEDHPSNLLIIKKFNILFLINCIENISQIIYYNVLNSLLQHVWRCGIDLPLHWQIALPLLFWHTAPLPHTPCLAHGLAGLVVAPSFNSHL